MASIEKRNGRWRVRWYDGSGHRSRTFDRKVDAERWMVKVSHDLLSGTYVDPRAGTVTFRDYAEEWRADRVHRDSTAAQIEGHFRLHVYPAIGDLPIARIRPLDIQRMVNGMELAPATVRVVLKRVAAVFRTAVRDRVISASPVLDIELPVIAGAPLQILAGAEVAAVAGAIPPRLRISILLGAGAGLRVGEMCGLTDDRIDFGGHQIVVDRQISGRRRSFAPLKTAASYRVVPVPAALCEAVRAHMGDRSGLVLTGVAGGPQRGTQLATAFRRTVARIDGPKWATPHDLRHFYASMLIHHGHDVKTIQNRLGHQSAAMTLDVYGHLFHSREEETRAIVDSELGDLFRGTAGYANPVEPCSTEGDSSLGEKD